MTAGTAYSNISLFRRRHNSSNIFAFFVLLFVISIPGRLSGQETGGYDEIPVYVEVPRLGGTDLTAVIKGNVIYLPITDLFDFIKIKNVPAPGLESISGFFISPDAPFTISHSENLISYQNKTINLEPGDLIRTESNLYLKASYLGKVFGLECNFNFRSLTVTVNSKLELPLIREMRQEEMRRNLTRLKGEVKADTNIRRSYPLFRFGMADWSAIASEEINGKSETRLNLALGSMIAGGEATASLNYNSQNPFTEKDQYYLWRYVDNDFSPLRQVMAGKIASHSISTIYNPVIGVQFTNTPTTYRRSFGTYTLSDKTEPGWVVELYVNNVLVDYVKADASGFFKFEIPLVYGNSLVKLKFFGPWGEERTREQSIDIPFSFLPKNTMEYNVGAGFVEDSLWSRFSRADIKYGLTRSLTLGGGVEYLSSVKAGPAMPYLNASIRILNNLLLWGEYTYGVRTKGTLSYRLPSNLQFDLNYTKYEKDQTAINYNYLEERKASVSFPLKISKFSTYQRFTYYNLIMPFSKSTTGEWLFSGSFSGVSANLTTYAMFISKVDPNIYSNLSLALRLPWGIVLMPQTQYGYTQGRFLSARVGVEKHLLEHGFLNLSYEQNMVNNVRLAELGFRYDFSFAQTGASVQQSNKKTTFVQYARGSLINDRSTKYLGVDNRSNVGRGGISVIPFLDINANGVRDAGEPKVFGLNLHANGGRVEKSDADTTIRILGLEPYTSCFIELDPNSFENLTWKLPVRTLSVTVDPDIIKHIEIPVTVVGEASGSVTLDDRGVKRGIGRIIITIYDSNSKIAGKTLTEDDGYYSYLGLAPDNYKIMVDTSQLRRLGMGSRPGYLEFNIASGKEGDIVDRLDFTLFKVAADTTQRPDTTAKVIIKPPVVRKDTSVMVVHEVTQELVTIAEDSYAIQLGAFRKKSNADGLRLKLSKLLGRKVDIIVEDGLYKVRINEIKERKEVDEIIAKLQKNGITELWLISLKAKKQQWVVSERKDTVTTISETVVEPGMSMQVGAFRKETNANKLKEKLSASIGKPVTITREGEYYKVRISGFKDRAEMKKYMPSLGKYGVKGAWMLPAKKQTKNEPLTGLSRTPAPSRIPGKEDIRLYIIPEARLKYKETKVVSVVVPKFALQVGEYIKRSQALKAQKKIEAKFSQPVELVQKWEFYVLIIHGFYSRQETFKFYPELAGMGITKISLIEEKQ
jgi:cell division protein FtsN